MNYASNRSLALSSGLYAGLILSLESVLNFYHQWPSLELADKIMNHVPEMRFKPTLELGAGNGYQSFLFSLKGIKIKATDIEPAQPTKRLQKIITTGR